MFKNIKTAAIISTWWNLWTIVTLFCQFDFHLHTVNYPKKPGFNLYQSRHCAYITYSVKTWFLKILSVHQQKFLDNWAVFFHMKKLSLKILKFSSSDFFKILKTLPSYFLLCYSFALLRLYSLYNSLSLFFKLSELKRAIITNIPKQGRSLF